MSVADDYPAVAILHDAWMSKDRTGETPPQAVQMFQEIEQLRRWKAEATEVMGDWEAVYWMTGVSSLGRSLADCVGREIQRLRSENAAWMNGVADVVEPFGFDRQAASGPADLLPGLQWLVSARQSLSEQVHELETRLERHPATTGCRAPVEGVISRTHRHRLIPQGGANVCVCGEWFDAEVHQVDGWVSMGSARCEYCHERISDHSPSELWSCIRDIEALDVIEAKP